MATNKDVAMKKALSELAEGKFDPSMSKDYDKKMANYGKKKKKKKPFPQKDLDEMQDYEKGSEYGINSKKKSSHNK